MVQIACKRRNDGLKGVAVQTWSQNIRCWSQKMLLLLKTSSPRPFPVIMFPRNRQIVLIVLLWIPFTRIKRYCPLNARFINKHLLWLLMLRTRYTCIGQKSNTNTLIFCFRDHAGGNEKMLKLMPGLKVYGGDDRVDAITKKVSHSNTFKVRRANSLLCGPTISFKWTIAHLCFSLLRLAHSMLNAFLLLVTRLVTFVTTWPKKTALNHQLSLQVWLLKLNIYMR